MTTGTHADLSAACSHQLHQRCGGECEYCDRRCECSCHSPARRAAAAAKVDARARKIVRQARQRTLEPVQQAGGLLVIGLILMAIFGGWAFWLAVVLPCALIAIVGTPFMWQRQRDELRTANYYRQQAEEIRSGAAEYDDES